MADSDDNRSRWNPWYNGNRKVTISLGTIVALVTIAGPIWWIAAGYTARSHRLDEMQQSLHRIENHLSENNWTRSDQRRWQYRLNARNPDMSVPNANDVWDSGSRDRINNGS